MAGSVLGMQRCITHFCSQKSHNTLVMSQISGQEIMVPWVRAKGHHGLDQSVCGRNGKQADSEHGLRPQPRGPAPRMDEVSDKRRRIRNSFESFDPSVWVNGGAIYWVEEGWGRGLSSGEITSVLLETYWAGDASVTPWGLHSSAGAINAPCLVPSGTWGEEEE